jgi:hypothetical protein
VVVEGKFLSINPPRHHVERKDKFSSRCPPQQERRQDMEARFSTINPPQNASLQESLEKTAALEVETFKREFYQQMESCQTLGKMMKCLRKFKIL